MNKNFSLIAKKRQRWWLLATLLFCLLPLTTVLAHGGGELKVGNAPIGSYLVSAWVNPPTAQSGQVIHVTVGIAAAGTGEPVLDAAVDVHILDEVGAEVVTAVATTEQSVNRLFYEADLEPVATGAYEMRVVVTGRAGEGDVVFPLEVVPRTIWPWAVGIAVGVAVIGLVVRSWRKGAGKRAVRGRTAVPRKRSVD